MRADLNNEYQWHWIKNSNVSESDDKLIKIDSKSEWLVLEHKELMKCKVE